MLRNRKKSPEYKSIFKSKLNADQQCSESDAIFSIVRDPLSEQPQHLYVLLEFIEGNSNAVKANKPSLSHWKFDLQIIPYAIDENINLNAFMRMRYKDQDDFETMLYYLTEIVENLTENVNQNEMALSSRDVREWAKQWRKTKFERINKKIKNGLSNKGIVFSLAQKLSVDAIDNIFKKLSSIAKLYSENKSKIDRQSKSTNEQKHNDLISIIELWAKLKPCVMLASILNKLTHTVGDEKDTILNNIEEKITGFKFDIINTLEQMNRWEVEYYYEKIQANTQRISNIPNINKLLIKMKQRLIMYEPKTKKNSQAKKLEGVSSISVNISRTKAKRLFAFWMKKKCMPPQHMYKLMSSKIGDNKGNCTTLAIQSATVVGHKIPRQAYTTAGYITSSKLLMAKKLKLVGNKIKDKLERWSHKLLEILTRIYNIYDGTGTYRFEDQNERVIKYANHRLDIYINNRTYFRFINSMSFDRRNAVKNLRNTLREIRNKKVLPHAKYVEIFKCINMALQSTISVDKEKKKRKYRSKFRDSLADIKIYMMKKARKKTLRDLAKSELEICRSEVELFKEKHSGITTLNTLPSSETINNAIEILEIKTSSWKKCLLNLQKILNKMHKSPMKETKIFYSLVRIHERFKDYSSKEKNNSSETIEIGNPNTGTTPSNKLTSKFFSSKNTTPVQNVFPKSEPKKPRNTMM